MTTLNHYIIKSLREKENFESVNSLAQATGIAQTTLNRTMNEETELTINRLLTICDALGYDISYIVREAQKTMILERKKK